MKEQEKFYKLPLSTIQGVVNFLNSQPVVQLRDLVVKAEEIKDCEKTECKHNPTKEEEGLKIVRDNKSNKNNK